MGNCITALFRGNCGNRGGARAARAAGGGWASRRRDGCGWRDVKGSGDECGRVSNGSDGWRAPGASSGRTYEMAETRAYGKRTRPGPQGTKPVRPVRGPATRDEVPRKVGQRWQHLRAMHDFRALDAKRGP